VEHVAVVAGRSSTEQDKGLLLHVDLRVADRSTTAVTMRFMVSGYLVAFAAKSKWSQ